MLYPLKQVLDKAASSGASGPSAVASMNVVDIDMVRAILGAAEEIQSPVIIAVATRHWNKIDAPSLVPSIRGLCSRSTVPVALHLDHAAKSQMDIIETALDLGFTSIMVDGSKEEYDENIQITREVTLLAHKRGSSVEGELGAVGGIEGVAEYAKPDTVDAVYTDPLKARQFVQATGIDALAVAVGTAHGLYKAEPDIQIDLIGLIAENCPVPLVMHGASGVPHETIRRSIAQGILSLIHI